MHKALGRGLDALLQPSEGGVAVEGGEMVAKVPVEKIHPNRYQPRTNFEPEALKELAESIRAHGLAQPLLISPSAIPGEFELVAGERRLRASKMAGLTEIPCVVRPVSERERSELSLIENIQREDLNALEEADALRKLMAEFGLTQEEVAQTLGRSRPAVANKLRLLDLPDELKMALREGRLSEGHARTLLGITDRERQAEIGRRILQEKLTVREVEKLVLDWQSAAHEGRVKATRRKNPDVRHLEEELQRALGRKVEIQGRGKKGWVRISFYSLDDLQALLDQLKGKKNASGSKPAKK